MKIISFEGIEGAGKTTQINLLKDYLDSNNITCTLLREPGSTPGGEMIRKVLLSNEITLSSMTELLLMFSARAEMVNNLIKKSDSEFIVLDRYFHASLAYQGYGRGISLDKIYNLIKITECPEPNLTIVLDIEPSKGFERKRHDEKDRIENSGNNFFTKVKNGYVALADRYDYVKIIDAQQTEKNIHNQIIDLVNSI
ncbi:dTMP kinase [SAR86 cluster bacterium]|nr:dTMP kinase [SAR86 cluster bacterium]